MVYVPDLTYGQVLYKNEFRRSLVTSYDGTEIDGFGYINAYDWADWSLFLTELSADRRLTFSFPLNTTFNTFAVYVVPFTTYELPDEAIIGLALIGEAQIGQSNGSCTVTLEKETGSGTGIYTVLATKIFTGTAQMYYVNLAATHTIAGTERVRVRFNNTGGSQLVVRDMALGLRLDFDMGQHAGVAPPTLTSNVVLTNSVSVNGSLLGRQSRQMTKTMEIDLQPVAPDWVRTYWEPFAQHAVKKPFYYAWNYATYPLEVCLASATDIPAPENAMPVPKMKCNMPLRVI